MRSISEIDVNFAVFGVINNTEVNFFNVRCEPFSIYGLLTNEGDRFRRLPTVLAEQVNPGVLRLHGNTAGGRVRFRTDSSFVAIRAVMPDRCLMSHMPFLGSSGFDLYEDDGADSHYRGSFMPPLERKDSYESILQLGTHKSRSFTIHFPLYDDVSELYVGLEPGATLEAGEPYRDLAPILFYGSSITQGGCASRPGNAYSNIISRNLHIDHRNLGFAGSCKGEPAIAAYIAAQRMSLFFMDYDHNTPTVEHLQKTHEKFFLSIREGQPDLPIVMASRTDIPWMPSRQVDRQRRRDIILQTYENAVKRGDRRVYFVDGSTVFQEAKKLGVSPDSCTVDGTHPNDLGFACMAGVFGNIIKDLLIK